MKITTFASGSGGNCALVQAGDTRLLVDAGISLRRIKTALARQSLFLDDICGILITHEHSDHIAALPMIVKYSHLPVYAPRTVANALCRTVTDIEPHLRVITPDKPFSVGKLTVTAFHTSHDTDESVGYRIDGDVSFGFCTDTGCVTEGMLRCLPGCGGALIEANHDPELLRAGPYPLPLKRRILSEHGHLSNADCAEFACRLAESGAKTLVLGHLSRENNRPELALSTVRGALDARGYTAVTVETAPPDLDLTVESGIC